MPNGKLIFTVLPNRALHRRKKRETTEDPPHRGAFSEQEQNTDTTRVRVLLASNSNPDGSGKFDVQRHEAQKKGLQTGQVTTAGENLFYTVVALTDTTKTDTSNLDSWDLLPLTERYGCYDIKAVDTGGEKDLLPDIISYSGEQLFQERLYLFNVIVALEWNPSRRTIQQLIAAFQNASDFLYDATDGYMAFGQVVFGGMELMPGADIQIQASNRFHPRSWVNGLTDPAKFTPIRLGRGIWHKNNSVSIPWNEPEGYRTIVHEWGHYALGLLDEYLEPSRRQDNRTVQDQPNLVIPKLSIANESIMATLEGTSEIVPQQHRQDAAVQHALEQISTLYPGVDLKKPVNDGPYKLPIELPAFSTTNSSFGTDAQAEELLIDADDISLEHCWVYVLRWNNGNPPLPRIIAQGSLDARSRRDPDAELPGSGFPLYGVRADDTLLFIGYDPENNNALKVERRRVGERIANVEKRKTTLDGDTATPVSIPVVTVIPESLENVPLVNNNTPPLTKISVRIVGTPQPDQVWVCPLGQPHALKRFEPDKIGNEWRSESFAVTHLDGQVLLRWNVASQKDPADGQYIICDYSQGGGPTSNVKAPDPPITAGSSDGNVMFFFRSDIPKSGTDRPANAKTRFADKSNAEIHLEYSKMRIVTTRNYAGFDDKNPGEPRSYLFSAAATRSIPAEELSPTLVMNFDRDALEGDGVLQIKQYDETPGDWIGPQTHIPKGAFFAAIAIEKKNGLEPFDTQLPQGGIAHYRLFLIPPSPTGGAD